LFGLRKIRFKIGKTLKNIHTISISKDNEAARRRLRRRIYKYIEEADDAANKVSQRKRIGIKHIYRDDAPVVGLIPL